MKARVLGAMLASLLLWSCSSSSKPAYTPAPSEKSMMAKDSAAGFYAEGTHKGRLCVFGTEKAHLAFTQSQQVPNISKAFIGAGPDGQTVVLEADPKGNELQERLRSLYEAKHGSKLQ